MIRVRLLQPGQPDVEVAVEGDSAVIGRDARCDVVVPQPFVSKRHVQILKGLVLVDLRSSNGTFVNGEKVTKPQLLSEGLFNLAERLDIAVSTDGEVSAKSGLEDSREDPLALLREQLESERARAAVLAGELADLRRRGAMVDGGKDEQRALLAAENQDLRGRLQSLKDELEGREVADAGSLQARLAQEELRTAQRKNEELARRVRALEGGAHGRSSAGPGASEELGRLRAELAAARKAALPPSELFAQLNRENQELRARLDAFESGRADPAMPASELFFQLQKENGELRRRIEELEAAPPSIVHAKPAKSGGARSAELERLRASLVAAEGEVTRLRAGAGRGSGTTPSRKTTAVTPGAALDLVRLVAERDIEKVELGPTPSVEAFLVFETLRFLRGAERVVTRAAGEMIQLYDQRTILPDMQGNFRSLARRLLEGSEGPSPRQELSAYLDQLSRWQVVALGAPRKAALEFAVQLRNELTEEALTADRPMPAFYLVAQQREAELWRRASEHLKGLSPELIDDRLEKLSRETARGLLGLREEAT